MSTGLDTLLSEMRAGLEGATPTFDSDLMRYDHGGGRLAVLRNGERRLVADFYHEADREHYGRCSPDNMLSILDHVDALAASLAETLSLAVLKWGNLDPDANVVFERARSLLGRAGK